MVRKSALALLAGLVAVLASHAAPVSAGGGRLSPVQDRYEPGQTATMVGYTGAPTPAAAGEPFYAYLRPAGEAPGARLLSSDVYVGELVVERTAHRGYLELRVSLTFEVPGDLVAGEYDVLYCDDQCVTPVVGDIVSSPLSIGVDPARRVVREWAPDEPEIANLAPEALLVGPGFQTTAGDLRAAAARRTAAPVPPVTAVTPITAAEPPSTTVAAPPPTSDTMAWPLPTALVLGSAAITALVLSRRRPAPAEHVTSTRSGASGERRTERAAAGRG